MCSRFRDIDGPIKCCGPLAKVQNFWASYNSNAPELNFTKRECEGSLDIPFVLVFLEFLLVSAQRPSEDDRVWIFAQKWRFRPLFLGGGAIFMGYHALTKIWWKSVQPLLSSQGSSLITGYLTEAVATATKTQIALLLQRGRAMLRVCRKLALIVQYVERNLLLLVTSASDLPLRTNRYCSVLFSSAYSLMRGGLRAVNRLAP